ncbi:hypothetical protein [Luteimicrobium sp. DT211]|uniref:hypothetical protein n=1 Tax=Luteimicrobium sp. DT211 TaxID=3393412 RepID=UPI003CFA15F0
MSAHHEPGPAHEPVEPRRGWVFYTTVGLLLAGVLLVMLVVFDNHRDNQDARQADQLAQTLQTELRNAGMIVPEQHTIEQVLGSDGGAVCADPGGHLQSLRDLNGVSGAAGPGLRPGPVVERLVDAERLVVQVYCPDELDSFDDYVGSLNLGDSTTTTTDQE